jgi:hypothetical protein
VERRVRDDDPVEHRAEDQIREGCRFHELALGVPDLRLGERDLTRDIPEACELHELLRRRASGHAR